MTTEHFRTGSKKGRGMAKASLTLIDAMKAAAEKAHPITGRGVGYKLFVAGLIASMKTKDMQAVYRLLKLAREKGFIDWHWIVDETRGLERVATWDDPEEFARHAADMYRLDNWNQQPHRVQLWSEKGTVRGLLKPVLTDRDPSGSYMSEVDLPKRLAKYGGTHVTIKRLALTMEQIAEFPEATRGGFPASDKSKDPRYKWFTATHGDRCWELDAMDPNELREIVRKAILEHIEPVAWERCERVNKAQQGSLGTVLSSWKACASGGNGQATTPPVPDGTPWWMRPRATWITGRSAIR
jgi:hypothetical protein